MSLKITPQINKVTRFIKLKINQDIKDFAAQNKGSAEGVTNTVRKAITTVVVRDKDTIAMGGLMRDKETTSVNKVPLLGDIPVLGWLFKQQAKTITKVNLLFFLTPRILAPYEKTTARTLKDVVNRRAAHLKSVHGDKDPFAVTNKELFEKAKRQMEGPLYDEEEAGTYKRLNEQNLDENPIKEVNNSIDTSNQEPLNEETILTEKSQLEETVEVPNYKKITQEVKTQKILPNKTDLSTTQSETSEPVVQRN